MHPPITLRRTLSQRAFSLVEILVSVAIVGILASLLVGGYSKVIARAQSVRCLSNMKQIGASLMLYVGENDGYLPRATIPKEETGLSGDLMWSKQLGPYLPQKGTSLTAAVNSIFNCPSAKYDGFPQTSGLSGTYNCTAALYGLQTFTSPTSLGVAGTGPGRKMSVLEYPSKTVLVAEGKAYQGGNACLSNVRWDFASTDLGKQTPSQTTYLDFRHDNSMNVIYGDGHAGTLPFTLRSSIVRANWEGRNYTD